MNKKTVNRILISTLILLFAFGFTAGCSKKSGGGKNRDKNTITFWHTMNTEEAKTLQVMVEDFEKMNPGVKIVMQPVPFDQAQNKFKITAQAGDAPDVFRSEIAWTCEEAALGYLIELDDYVSKEDLEDYMEAPMAYNRYKGHIYGIPQVTDCLALLYNKRIFSEAGLKVPETMEEFRDTAMKLTVDNNGHRLGEDGFDKENVDRYGFYFTGKAYDFQPFMWAFGGGLVDVKNKKILINSHGTIEAIDFIKKARDVDGYIPNKFDLNNAYNNMMAGFKKGHYAMIVNGPWATADLLTGDEFKDSDNLGVAVIPKGPGGYGSPVGGHNYVISRNCQNPELAWKFISHLNRPENQRLLAMKNNLLPTRKSTYQLEGVGDNQFIRGFKNQLDVARNRPVAPQGGQIYNDFTPYFQAAYLGAMSPQQAMNDLAGSWKKLFGW